MKLNDDELRDIWREGSAQPDADRSACLTDTEWARLLSPDADARERTRAATHVTLCAVCAEELRLLKPLMSWRSDVEDAFASGELARGRATATRHWLGWWTSPRVALAAGGAVLLVVANAALLFQLVETRRDNASLETRLAERERAAAIAERGNADLQETLRGTAATDAELKQQLARLSVPRLDTQIADLVPRPAEQLRGVLDEQVITVSADAPLIAMVLNFGALPSDATLEADVVGPAEVRWTGRTTSRAGAAAATLTLPGSYPPGRYAIRLFDLSRERTSLGEYSVTIRRAPDPRQ